MLKTVSFPTLSAVGNTVRTSAKEAKLRRFMFRYQCSRAVRVSGWSRAKSFKRFRVMKCRDRHASSSAAGQRLVVPHEELLVFLKDAFRDAASYGNAVENGVCSLT